MKTPAGQDRHAVYADEWIEYWGDIFAEHNLAAYGLRFEQFLESPRETLARFKQGDDRPLLAVQQAIQVELDKKLPRSTVMWDGRLIEPDSLRSKTHEH